jgi:hypothetical protein
MSAAIDTTSGSDPTSARLRALTQSTGIFTGGGVSYPFSVSAWVKQDATGWNRGQAAILGLNQGTTNVNHFYLSGEKGSSEANADGRAYIRDSSTSTQVATGNYTDDNVENTWTLIVGVWVSATERYVYLDTSSTKGGSASETSVSPASVDSITIGSGREFSDGLTAHSVAEIAIWSTNLSDSDVTDLETKTPDQVQAASLQHYWPLYDDLNDDKGSITLVDVNTNVTLSTVDHPSLSSGSASVVPHAMQHLINMNG